MTFRHWMILAAALGACAHRSPPPAQEPSPATRVKAAVLTAESDLFPMVASALNASLKELKLPGVDDYFVSKVTLETAQLAIECVDPTRRCWTAVGKSLQVSRLVLAQIEGAAHRHSVRVVLTLFDVDAGAPSRVVDHRFKSADEASADEASRQAAKLVAELAQRPEATEAAK
jgi:hypothetical protein